MFCRMFIHLARVEDRMAKYAGEMLDSTKSLFSAAPLLGLLELSAP